MTEQNKNHKVYLWANYRGKLDPDKVAQWEFENDSIHAFINTAKPLFADVSKFIHHRLIMFVRTSESFRNVNDKLNRRGYYSSIFSEVYKLYDRVYDKMWICKGENDDVCLHPGNIYKNPDAKTYNMKVKVDDFDLHDEDVAMVGKWGRSSGFMAYRFLRDMYPDHEIITVNFHRREDDNEAEYLPYQNHNIGAEEKWFKEHNVKNIVLG
jgi:hypothetical protein